MQGEGIEKEDKGDSHIGISTFRCRHHRSLIFYTCTLYAGHACYIHQKYDNEFFVSVVGAGLRKKWVGMMRMIEIMFLIDDD